MKSFDRPRKGMPIALLTPVLAALMAATLVHPQQPPTATGTSQTIPYRPPTIALVQPTGVGAVPRDKPIVVFRFAAGETDDPIDARSFAVAVDGVSRSTGFQLADNEAWGPLSGAVAGDSMLAPGPHAVSARICSVRGLCATADVTVAVDSGTNTRTVASPGTSTDKPPTARARLIARVLEAVRKIFVP